MFDILVHEKRIGQEVGERMRAAVGFRNIAIHNYESIDWQIVYAICTTHMADFSEFARLVYHALSQVGESN